MRGTELAWLAGLLEGEGSFIAASTTFSPRISLQMADRDVVERAATLVGASPWTASKRNDRWRVAHGCQVKGLRAVTLMTALRPLMGQRRQQQIDEAVQSFAPRYRPVEGAALAQLRERFDRGDNRTALARDFGISRQTVYSLCRRDATATRPRQPPAAARTRARRPT